MIHRFFARRLPTVMGPTLGVLLLGIHVAPLLHAADDSLSTIQRRGVLRWGGDTEGGGPFVYPRDDNPAQQQGFEVDLAARLAQSLGVQAQFVHGQWDKLPELVKRGEIDVVLDGYEWKPTWQGRYGTTIPYYVYQLQWLTRVTESRFHRPQDLRSRTDDKPRIAVLGASAAEAHVRETLGDAVEVALFEGTTDGMRAVELEIDGIDATLQDLPIVDFYQSRFPGLQRLGEPVATGYYVGLTRPEDQTLLQALNRAILDAARDGSLREICLRYGMWNALQQQRGLETDAAGNFRPLSAESKSQGAGGPDAVERRASSQSDLWRRVPLLWQGALVTIFLSIVSMPLAITAGISIATGRVYGPPWLQRLLTLYVELIRGTPLVLQLYVIFFMLPELGITLPALVAAVFGLALNYSAYEAEIYRAGLQAVPLGQMEAALSLGMTRSQALRRIVVPQAVRIVIPPVLNDFIALFKDTAVCSVITVVELSKQYYIHAQSTGAIVELALVTALFYLGMSYPLALWVGRLERHMDGEIAP